MISQPTLRIATRKSPLALWQAKEVARRLAEAHPQTTIELVGLTTRGDQILNSPLSKVGGKGLFVKELEHALLSGSADIAVHSMKDVPAEFPQGLHLPVILEREDPRDAFVSNHYGTLEELPEGAVVGTSSLRRQCQLKARLPHLAIRTLRGNVNTRLGKLDAGECDAIILATAGLKRLALAHRITCALDTSLSLPAIGQGAIGIECRLNDTKVAELIEVLSHTETQVRVGAERAMNLRLGGSCQTPIAGFAEIIDSGLRLRGLVAYPDGSTTVMAQGRGPITEPEELGQTVAEDLLAQGAGKILQTLEHASP